MLEKNCFEFKEDDVVVVVVADDDVIVPTILYGLKLLPIVSYLFSVVEHELRDTTDEGRYISGARFGFGAGIGGSGRLCCLLVVQIKRLGETRPLPFPGMNDMLEKLLAASSDDKMASGKFTVDLKPEI